MVALFLACFVLHEIEEICRLPGWVRAQRQPLARILPKAVRPVLDISAVGFGAIAAWEGIIILAVSLLLPKGICWFAMVAAYTLHLFIHIGQYIALKKHAVACPVLYSVLAEIPICLYILYSHLHIAPAYQLISATALMSAFAAMNLLAAHQIMAGFGRK